MSGEVGRLEQAHWSGPWCRSSKLGALASCDCTCWDPFAVPARAMQDGDSRARLLGSA